MAFGWARLGDASNARCFFHMADAPCHAVAYHERGSHGSQDRRPEGGPKGRDLGTLLPHLNEVQGVMEHTFTNTSPSTPPKCWAISNRWAV